MYKTPSYWEIIISIVLITGAAFSSLLRSYANHELSDKIKEKNMLLIAFVHVLGSFGAGVLSLIFFYKYGLDLIDSSIIASFFALPGWAFLDFVSSILICKIKKIFDGLK